MWGWMFSQGKWVNKVPPVLAHPSLCTHPFAWVQHWGRGVREPYGWWDPVAPSALQFIQIEWLTELFSFQLLISGYFSVLSAGRHPLIVSSSFLPLFRLFIPLLEATAWLFHAVNAPCKSGVLTLWSCSGSLSLQMCPSHCCSWSAPLDGLIVNMVCAASNQKGLGKATQAFWKRLSLKETVPHPPTVVRSLHFGQWHHFIFVPPALSGCRIPTAQNFSSSYWGFLVH